MTWTRKQIALALLAGSPVVVGVLTLQFTGIAAQDRLAVKTLHDTHYATRILIEPDGDGGVKKRDLLQEASDACTVAGRAFRDAKEQHITTATGSPSIETLKQQRAVAKVVCDDYRVLATAVEAARAAYEGADVAYGCSHLNGPCPEAGSDGGT
jgi:hypothetical protein